MIPDLTGEEWTDEQLDLLAAAVEEEKARRRVILLAAEQAEAVEKQLEAVQEAYERAIGRETGAEWVQPTGAHDAYRLGATVIHEGAVWRSLIPSNVWEPGTVAGLWEKVDEDDPDFEPIEQPDAPAWIPGIAYVPGDLVTFQGVVYRVVQAHTAASHWPPDHVPALYVTA